MEATLKSKRNIAVLIALASALLGATMFFLTPDTAVKLIGAVITMAVVFTNPLWGVYLMILAIPFLNNVLTLVFMALVVASYILRVIVKREKVFVATPIDLPIILFITVQVIATITSVNPVLSARNLMVDLLSFAFYFVVINTVNTKEKLDKAIKAFIIIALLLSLLGIVQYFTLGETNKAWTDRQMNPELKTRVVGTFDNPNVFAEYLEHIIPATLVLFFTMRKRLNKLLAALVGGAMVLCLIMTFSRAAWLGFAAAVLFIFVLKFSKYIPALIAGGIAAVPLLPRVVLTRIMTIGNVRDTSNAYRMNAWEGTLNMIRDFWITGVGFGYWAFKNTFLEYSIGGTLVWHSHNMYLELAAEMGIFGLLTFLWVMFLIFKSVIKFSRTSKDKYLNYMSVALAGSILSLMVHGIAEHILYMPKSILLFWLIVGLIMATLNIGKTQDKEQEILT